MILKSRWPGILRPLDELSPDINLSLTKVSPGLVPEDSSIRFVNSAHYPDIYSVKPQVPRLEKHVEQSSEAYLNITPVLLPKAHVCDSQYEQYSQWYKRQLVIKRSNALSAKYA
jgi:hypothetical protein